MIHIQSKQQLLEWLEQNLKDRAARTALHEGKAELITPFSPYPEGGWVVEIVSKRGTIWYAHILFTNSIPPKLRCYVTLSYNSMKNQNRKGIADYR